MPTKPSDKPKQPNDKGNGIIAVRVSPDALAALTFLSSLPEWNGQKPGPLMRDLAVKAAIAHGFEGAVPDQAPAPPPRKAAAIEAPAGHEQGPAAASLPSLPALPPGFVLPAGHVFAWMPIVLPVGAVAAGAPLTLAASPAIEARESREDAPAVAPPPAAATEAAAPAQAPPKPAASLVPSAPAAAPRKAKAVKGKALATPSAATREAPSIEEGLSPSVSNEALKAMVERYLARDKVPAQRIADATHLGKQRIGDLRGPKAKASAGDAEKILRFLLSQGIEP